MSLNRLRRPKNLDLMHIRLPVGGLVSILHRITGVLLVLSMPFAFVLMQRSLQGPEEFAQVRMQLGTVTGRILLFCLSVLVTHHFLAGLRHLLLDLDLGISRRWSRAGAWLVLAGVTGMALLVGTGLFL